MNTVTKTITESERRDRKEIATAMMQGLVSNSGGPYQANNYGGWGIVNTTHDQLAMEAVELADALIRALEVEQK